MTFNPLKTLSKTLTIITISLAFPAVAIMASWNSLPGSFCYPVKRGLEKIALALIPNSIFESELRLKLIDRRTDEIASSITQSPRDQSTGLNNLIAEAQAAQLQTTNLKPQQRQLATKELVKKLQTTKQSLETTKQTVVHTHSTTIVYQTQVINNTQTIVQQITPPAQTQTETAPTQADTQEGNTTNTNTQPENSPNEPLEITTKEEAQETVEEIEETVEEIEEIIEELEITINQQSSSQPDIPIDLNNGQLNNDNSNKYGDKKKKEKD